jgi:hypothetical protein
MGLSGRRAVMSAPTRATGSPTIVPIQSTGSIDLAEYPGGSQSQTINSDAISGKTM